MIEILVIAVLLAAFIYDAEMMLDQWFGKKVIINCEHQPYLHRWYIFKGKRLTMFAHKFVRSDEDRALHDHPWAFLVIPIWRGYIEHSDRRNESYDHQIEHNKAVWRATGCSTRVAVINRVLPFLGTRYRDFFYRHRVELLKNDAGEPLPAWSIFFHFTRRRDWGYWLPGGFVLHSKWWADLCE